MSAVQEVQAAIETLERMKRESTPGPNIDLRNISVENGRWFEWAIPQLQTVHRTLDAQLTILEDFAFRYRNAYSHWVPSGPGAAQALALARAINRPA